MLPDINTKRDENVAFSKIGQSYSEFCGGNPRVQLF